MSKQLLVKRILTIQGEVQRLNSALYALSTMDIQRYPDNYEAQSIDAALRAEKITARLRQLIYTTTGVKAEDYLPHAASAQGIEVREEDGIVEITLPSLLPKRKQQQGAGYVLLPLNAALSQYAQEHTMPHYEHCVVCFCNIYDRSLPERRVRDYDNLELKQFLDVAASFLMVDDSGLLCDAYHTTEMGETDCTRIIIMDSGRFPEWISKRHTALKAISCL